MTLPEAIETNDDTRAFHLLRAEDKAAEAIRLGNEAMKAIIAWRNIEDNVDLMLLPGEAEK